jgi:hypothetical protein
MATAHTMFPFHTIIMMGDNLYGGDGRRDFEQKFQKPYKALLDRQVKFFAALGTAQPSIWEAFAGRKHRERFDVSPENDVYGAAIP